MSSQSLEKEIKTESKSVDPGLTDGFVANILDLVDLYGELARKIESKGITSPCSSGVFELAKMFIGSQNPDRLITDFIHKSNEQWKECNSREEKILFDNVKSLFPIIPDDKLQSIAKMLHVKDKAGEEIVTKEDIDSIWEYVTEFVRIAISYIHARRCWGKRPDGKIGYTVTYFKDISVKTYAEMFKVKLNK